MNRVIGARAVVVKDGYQFDTRVTRQSVSCRAIPWTCSWPSARMLHWRDREPGPRWLERAIHA